MAISEIFYGEKNILRFNKKEKTTKINSSRGCGGIGRRNGLKIR
jgi:hypothetical protein